MNNRTSEIDFFQTVSTVLATSLGVIFFFAKVTPFLVVTNILVFFVQYVCKIQTYD